VLTLRPMATKTAEGRSATRRLSSHLRQEAQLSQTDRHASCHWIFC